MLAHSIFFYTFSLIAIGTNKIDSYLAAMLMSTTPITGSILAHFFTRNEKITFLKSLKDVFWCSIKFPPNNAGSSSTSGLFQPDIPKYFISLGLIPLYCALAAISFSCFPEAIINNPLYFLFFLYIKVFLSQKSH